MKDFLGVSFDRDDATIDALIEAAKEAADEIIGDAFVPDQVNRIEDFESYADDAALNVAIPKIGSPTLKLSKESFEELQSMEIDYDVSGGEQGAKFDLPIPLDFRKAESFIIFVKGLKTNSEESLSLRARTASKEILRINTRPKRFTRFEEFKKIELNIERLNTIEGLDVITQFELAIDPQEAGTGKIIVDFMGFTVGEELPKAIKVGALRYIARKYQNRISGVKSESQGRISFSWGDPIPDEWEVFRRVPVE